MYGFEYGYKILGIIDNYNIYVSVKSYIDLDDYTWHLAKAML